MKLLASHFFKSLSVDQLKNTCKINIFQVFSVLLFSLSGTFQALYVHVVDEE